MILPKNTDKSVLVIEKHSSIAGNVYTEEIELNNVHVYGFHILHINEDKGLSGRDWRIYILVAFLMPFVH